MIILIDTDVLVDFALDRAPFADAAAALLQTLENAPGRGYVAWHSISNFYYLVTPIHGKATARQMVMDLTSFIEIAPTTTAHIRQAVELPVSDFEDAMQVTAALACGAELIATRNIRDYRRSPVRAVMPVEVVGSFRAS